MNEPIRPKVTWAEAFMTIGLRMIDKGQWILFVLSIWVTMFLWKLDAKELVDFWMSITAMIWLPWSLLGVSLLGWYFHVRFVDYQTKAENQRIGTEKKELQEKLLQYSQAETREAKP